jgi:arabinofuranosyltransferase
LIFAPWINHFEKLKTEEEKLRKNGITPRGDILHFAGGIHIYYLGGRRYLNDTFALGDPLLARLRGENYEGWLIGHVQRKIPAGYRDSVRTGRNVIADPQLHRYLDQLWLVTRSDDLLSPARLRAIFEFNTGQLRPSIN